MTLTLAEMTPAERADCVGRWCEHKHPLYTGMEVIVRVDVTGVNTYSPRNRWEFLVGDAMLGNLTPRLDLPRAWTPDGEPVPGDCEYAVGHVVEYADGQRDCHPRYREDSRQSALDAAENMKDDGYVAMSRFVTDWEEA